MVLRLGSVRMENGLLSQVGVCCSPDGAGVTTAEYEMTNIGRGVEGHRAF